MYDCLDKNGPYLFDVSHSLGQNTFLKILINSKNIDMVVNLLQNYQKQNYYYVAFDDEFVKISLIIEYLNEMSKNNNSYLDILDKLIVSGTYGMYSCGIEL